MITVNDLKEKEEYDNIEGYPIQKALEAYNAKSESKINNEVTIFKITI